MAWQDIAITICILAFSYALIPQIILGFKTKKSLIAKQTSTITAIGMATLGITYITMNLIFSSIISFITSGIWTIFLIQSIVYKSNS